MATRHLLADLVTAAVESGLPGIEIESTGGVDAARRVAAGEPVDLVLLARDALDALAADGHVDPHSVTDLVISQVAVAVPAESAAVAAGAVAERTETPAFTDAAQMKERMLDAPRIGYSTGPSGTALRRMLDGWGALDELDARLVQAPPGVPVAELLRHGEVSIGFQQESELIGQPGIRLLGTLPAECAIITVFSGAVAATASDASAVTDLLHFLTSPATAAVREQHGFRLP